MRVLKIDMKAFIEFMKNKDNMEMLDAIWHKQFGYDNDGHADVLPSNLETNELTRIHKGKAFQKLLFFSASVYAGRIVKRTYRKTCRILKNTVELQLTLLWQWLLKYSFYLSRDNRKHFLKKFFTNGHLGRWAEEYLAYEDEILNKNKKWQEYIKTHERELENEKHQPRSLRKNMTLHHRRESKIRFEVDLDAVPLIMYDHWNRKAVTHCHDKFFGKGHGNDDNRINEETLEALLVNLGLLHVPLAYDIADVCFVCCLVVPLRLFVFFITFVVFVFCFYSI